MENLKNGKNHGKDKSKCNNSSIQRRNYIEECVESVINQTLREIEIIIVNDGTKDNSIKKIEKYLSDPRVILINKENGGVSSARNTGLKMARGEYISFIDSDDFIELTMLEDLYNESKGMDIVLSNFARIDSLGILK